MRFAENMFLSRSIAGKENKIKMKLKLGIGMTGVYCIAVPLYGSDPLEIYNVMELKQRRHRRSPLLIVGMTGSRREAMYLSANILEEIHKARGDYDSRSYFETVKRLPEVRE